MCNQHKRIEVIGEAAVALREKFLGPMGPAGIDERAEPQRCSVAVRGMCADHRVAVEFAFTGLYSGHAFCLVSFGELAAALGYDLTPYAECVDPAGVHVGYGYLAPRDERITALAAMCGVLPGTYAISSYRGLVRCRECMKDPALEDGAHTWGVPPSQEVEACDRCTQRLIDGLGPYKHPW